MSRSGLKLFNTKLTRLLGIRTPIVLPPMAGAAGGELAGQVSSAGGFGFLSADFKQQLSLARSAFQSPSSTHAKAEFPVGVGYLAWQLEKHESPLVDLLPIALENNVQAICRVGKDKKTLYSALVATNEWKVDCIVAQGVESGGHGASYALPLLNLLPLILAAMPADSPPVLAAGGLANGGHVAAALTLGADGVVLGTRFLLAHESLYSDIQRKALVSANSEMSVRSMAWDHARGTLGWPAGVDGRGLRNSVVEDFENGVKIEALKSKFQDGIKNRDIDRMIVWAGTGSIVEELHRECIEHLAAASQLYF
ncbi:hypothetical protein B0H13DRAFT_2258183 [Mycena leptocephala]|nr:hypothetical protein B0H13DRAFT_2258183 [Mycena leptocephala]